MTDLDPTTILRERYEALAARRTELRSELEPIETEMVKLQAGLVAMGAAEGIEQVVPFVPRIVRSEALVPMGAEPEDDTGTARALHRVRHPDVQRAIETQTPSQAIPKGTALYCAEGCKTAHPSGGFTDLMALRTHTKRNHDREPTEQEKVPR